MTATATAHGAITHPRISARRAAVEDQRMRSRNRRLTIAGCVVLAILLAIASTQSPLLDVDEVRVVGAQRNTSADLREVVGTVVGEPLLGLDLAEIEQRLLGRPTIASATVAKNWDGVVTIEVVERIPVAQIATDDGVLLVAADGIVVERVTEALADLPVVAGAMFDRSPGTLVPDAVDEALVVAEALPPDVTRLVERVEISVAGVGLRLTGGGYVELGDARDLEVKLDAVRAFVAQVQLGCLESLNVQAPIVPVLTRRENCN